MGKPVAKLTETDGNVFALTGVCSRALKGAGMYREAEEMRSRVLKAHSFDEALCIMTEYVEVV